MTFNIAIDGPAGAGKSSIAKAAAAKLNFVYVDTGAMYRTIALYLLREKIDCEDTEALTKALSEIDIQMAYENGKQQMLLNGENVTELLRTGEVTRMASISSARKEVRARLMDLQQEIAAAQNVIMDGRDIGTAILPHAQLKVFMTASAHIRALRRYNQLKESGNEADLEKIEREIIERDDRDSHREASPLRQAEDAVYLDTSDMTIEEVTEKICSLARERMQS